MLKWPTSLTDHDGLKHKWYYRFCTSLIDKSFYQVNRWGRAYLISQWGLPTFWFCDESQFVKGGDLVVWCHRTLKNFKRQCWPPRLKYKVKAVSHNSLVFTCYIWRYLHKILCNIFFSSLEEAWEGENPVLRSRWLEQPLCLLSPLQDAAFEENKRKVHQFLFASLPECLIVLGPKRSLFCKWER